MGPLRRGRKDADLTIPAVAVEAARVVPRGAPAPPGGWYGESTGAAAVD
jgi:hypothetical protein